MELVKGPHEEMKKHFGSSIYCVCVNKMRFSRKRPPTKTKMSIPERVEYFTKVDGKMTNINCARFVESKPRASHLIARQV